MYSPYNEYVPYTYQSEKQSYANPGKVAAGIGLGVIGVGAVGAGMHALGSAHRTNYNKGGTYTKWMDKLEGSDFYKGLKMAPFRTQWTSEGTPLDQMLYRRTDRYKGAKNKLSKIHAPRQGTARYDKINSALSKRYLSLPVLTPAIALSGISSEFDQRNHASALVTGVGKEVFAGMGAFLGSKAGLMLGSSAGPLGTVVGALAGGAIGGAIGYGAFDMIGWMASKGKQWSTPETGGYFRDSQMGMTMRQRSLNAISSSQFNVRSSLGNEARFLMAGY